jgi:molybdopterin-guanine dinucleotide biosynthesis protein A
VSEPRSDPREAGARFDAVIVAGGAARRLDGIDKPLLEVGGRSLLDRVLAASAAADRTWVIGPERPVYRAVAWLREDPPGAGPAAALAAGVAAATRPWVLALAADLPFLDARAVHSLWTGAQGRDGAVLADADGRAQWLTACYRRGALLDRIGQLGPGALTGLSLRRLLAGLDLARVPAPGDAAMDCDTWDDVDLARRRSRDGAGREDRRDEL